MPLTVLSQPGNIVLAALLTGIFNLPASTYGVIVALPFVFNFLQVLLTPLLAQKLDAQRLCVASGWLHCIGWILLTVALPFIPAGDPVTAKWVFIVGFSIISLASSINGVAWNGWMQDVVPTRLRGKYFGVRNQLLYVSMIAFLLSVSGLLSFMKGSLFAYVILFGGAIVLRIFSVLWQQKMTSHTSHNPTIAQLPWQEQVKRVRQNPTLVRFIGFAAMMGFTINLFGPFVPVFMYEQLQITVAKANWILLFGPLGAAASFPAWGKLSDKYGNIPTAIVALALWQTFSLILCFVDTGNIWLIYIVSISGGLFSAGYGIGIFSLLLKLTPPDSRTMGIALFVSISCLAAAVAPPLGGFIISWAKAQGYNPLTIYHLAFTFAPIFSMLSCLVLRKVPEERTGGIKDVVGAIRNVRTVASLFGLSFLVNQVFARGGSRRRRSFFR